MNWLRRLGLALILCCFSTLLLADDLDKSRYERLGGKMQCTCSCNQMLLKCNHVGCVRSEEMIRDLKASLKAPKNGDEDVLNWFRQNYGVTTVIEPATHGFELTAWVVPPAVLTLALILVLLVIRSWRKRNPLMAVAGNIAVNPEMESLRSRARQETEI